MWEIIIWVLAIVALVIIGAIVVVKWIVKKGHKGYTRLKDRPDRT